MNFEKWQALGNDYLIVERSELPFTLTPARIRLICEGHFGAGADGILLLGPAEDDQTVATLQIYNPDGSRAELSGNGAREAILYLRQRGWTDRDTFTISTDAGPITPQITGPDTCRVDMGIAALASANYPSGAPDGHGQLTAGGRSWSFQHIAIGNPQCAIALAGLQELEALDLAALGPPIEGHELFPNRTNVSFYTELSAAGPQAPARIRARIFERGVGETLSSGTGASGAAIAYLLATHAGATGSAGGRRDAAAAVGDDKGGAGTGAVEVELEGGTLTVEVDDDLRVHLTGWARPVFAGRMSDEFIKELHETE